MSVDKLNRIIELLEQEKKELEFDIERFKKKKVNLVYCNDMLRKQ